MTKRRAWEIGAAAALLLTLAATSALALHYHRLNAQLSAALKEWDLPRIRQLLRQGADIRTRAPEGFSVLICAAAVEDDALAEEALERGLPPDERGPFGVTVLMTAAGAGREQMVRALLRAGADVNLREIYGKTALMYAASAGATNVVRLLLEHGVDSNAKDGSNRTAMAYADMQGATEVMSLLKRFGARDGRVGYDIDLAKAGVRFVRCSVLGDQGGVLFRLEYEMPPTASDDTDFAVRTYTRLRVPGVKGLLDASSWGSVGKRYDNLGFGTTERTGRPIPETVEVWWVKNGPKKIATVPCTRE
jgi:uncharacterized protein